MKRTFIEVTDFQKKMDSFKDVNLLETVQEIIVKDPEVGDLLKGTGGIRKIRVGAKGKGKSGGIRVFYLDVPRKEKCYLLFILEKSESDNIDDQERHDLKELAQYLKK